LTYPFKNDTVRLGFKIIQSGGSNEKGKGITSKKNGWDVLKLTATVEGKEPETRFFHGSLSKGKTEYIVQSYEVAALVKGKTHIDELIDLIKTVVEPDSWDGEAKAVIKADGTSILVVHTAVVHDKIGDLLVQLSRFNQEALKTR
jgi:hypothetical protein